MLLLMLFLDLSCLFFITENKELVSCLRYCIKSSNFYRCRRACFINFQTNITYHCSYTTKCVSYYKRISSRENSILNDKTYNRASSIIKLEIEHCTKNQLILICI